MEQPGVMPGLLVQFVPEPLPPAYPGIKVLFVEGQSVSEPACKGYIAVDMSVKEPGYGDSMRPIDDAITSSFWNSPLGERNDPTLFDDD